MIKEEKIEAIDLWLGLLNDGLALLDESSASLPDGLGGHDRILMVLKLRLGI